MYCVFLGKAVQTVTPPDGSVSESKLQVSNSPTNGQVLSAQSGAAGGLTWAADATTVTGYTNGVDNRVITSSGTTTLNGETNFIYNGTIAGLGPDGANADLGVGLHIKTADSGATAATQADELVIESNDHAGLSILTGTGSKAYINFGDSGDNGIGRVMYDHNINAMRFLTSGTDAMKIYSDGTVTKPLQPSFGAYGGAQTGLGQTTWITGEFDTEVFDVNADYDNGTYTFTAPVTGKYIFTVMWTLENFSGRPYSYFNTSNRTYTQSYFGK